MAPSGSKGAKAIAGKGDGKALRQWRSSGSWWPCQQCSSWSWADRPSCFTCKAAPPAWAIKQYGCKQQSDDAKVHARGFGSTGEQGAGDSIRRRAITLVDYPFLTVGKGKKARRQAHKLAKDMAELEDLRRGRGGESPFVEVAAEDCGEDAAGAKQFVGLSDDKLAQVINILDGELQKPYIEEQRKRREAKAAGKPVEVRARQAHDRLKKAQKKAEKAEAAANEAAVDLAKAEEKAAAAKEAAAEAAKDADKAKVEYEKFDGELAVQANNDIDLISISPDEAELICGTFLVVDEAAVLAACHGNEAEAKAMAARASELHAKLRAGKAAGGRVVGSGRRASSLPGVGHRPPGTQEDVQEMLREAREERAGHEGGDLGQNAVKGRGRGQRAGAPYKDASPRRSRSRE